VAPRRVPRRLDEPPAHNVADSIMAGDVPDTSILSETGEEISRTCNARPTSSRLLPTFLGRLPIWRRSPLARDLPARIVGVIC
jgi:hypothetical protein